jgi:hypothetical protein
MKACEEATFNQSQCPDVVKIQKFRTIEVPCKEHGNKWKKGTV